MHYKILKALLICLYYLSFSQNAHSQETNEKYSLFNPVPKDKMRPMISERPSKGDSSHTIDSGHLQIETSLYSYTKKKDAGSRFTEESVLNSTTFRLGITQSIEIQAVVTPVIWQKTITYSDSKTEQNRGFGDSVFRFKYNFIGNDSGDLSIAVIPHVKIPTNGNNVGNNYIEGGISLPMDVTLKDGYSLNYTIQNLYLKRTDGSKLESVFASAIALEKSFNDKISGFIEYYAKQDTDNTKYLEQTLDFGIVYALTKNVSIDGAVNFGLSNRSNDLEMLFGGSYRF